MPRRRAVLTPNNIWRVAPFEETQTALAAAQGLAHSRRPLSLITGPAGCGKSFSAEYYANGHPRVHVAVCPPHDVLTPKVLMLAVAESLGIVGAGFVRNSDLFAALVSRLAADPCLLIIDEADRLYASNADLLRELTELSETRVCFLGYPSLRSILARVPATHHRIGFSHAIPPVALEDYRQVLFGRFEDVLIMEIYEQTAGNLRHLEALLALLDVASSRGTRTLTPKVIRTLALRHLLQEAA